MKYNNLSFSRACLRVSRYFHKHISNACKQVLNGNLLSMPSVPALVFYKTQVIQHFT